MSIQVSFVVLDSTSAPVLISSLQFAASIALPNMMQVFLWQQQCLNLLQLTQWKWEYFKVLVSSNILLFVRVTSWNHATLVVTDGWTNERTNEENVMFVFPSLLSVTRSAVWSPNSSFMLVLHIVSFFPSLNGCRRGELLLVVSARLCYLSYYVFLWWLWCVY